MYMSPPAGMGVQVRVCRTTVFWTIWSADIMNSES